MTHTKKVVWKLQYKKKWGKGIRRKAGNNLQPAKNLYSFLRIDENISELFYVPSLRGISMKEEYQLYFNLYTGENWHTGFLHIQDMSRQGIRSIRLRTVDTDVIVIAIVLFSWLTMNKLWVEFGSRKNKVF